MSAIFCGGFGLVIGNGGVSLSNSSTHLGFPLNHVALTVRLLSTSPNSQKERPFVVSYLIDSCGLSPESAKSASMTVDFETPDGPDAVLSLLKDYGFTTTHFSKIFKSGAQLLLADPAKTLLPKLEFLCSICVSRSDLLEIVSCNPRILTRSLQAQLIPTYNMLKSLLGSDEEAFQSLRRCVWHATDMLKNAPINIALLRKLKVPQQKISFLLIYSPNSLCYDPNKFSENVNKVIETGMDPSEKLFVHALRVICQRSHKVWEQKIEVYKSWGLSEEQILLAFRRSPYCMSASAKKIRSIMDFVVNKMGYQPADVVICPPILSYSLEKRIIPRFSVIRVLQLNGLVKTDISIASVMVRTEKSFLNSFVINYEGKIPELMSVYRGQKSIQELGLEFETQNHAAGVVIKSLMQSDALEFIVTVLNSSSHCSDYIIA